MSIFNEGIGKKKNDNVDNFIQHYDKVLSDIECKSLIDTFESNKGFQNPGNIFRGNQSRIDPSIKESTEIGICPELLEDKVWGPCLKPIFTGLSESIKKYVKRYSAYTDMGAAGLDGIKKWGLEAGINFQKFEPNQGYKKWHCEASCSDYSPRVLAWMIYLNDVPDGGTDFLNSDTMEAKEGRLVIWPAYWTHFHKSQVSKTTTKYILTGWYRFVPNI